MVWKRENIKPRPPMKIKLTQKSDKVSSAVKNGKLMKEMFQCKVVLKRFDSNLEVIQPKVIEKPTNSIDTSTENKNGDQLHYESFQQTSPILQNAEVSKSASTGLCQFDCLECHATYNSWRSLYDHLRREHNKTVSLIDYETFLYKATVHICKLCLQKILCDSTFLSQHLNLKHKIKLHDYREKYNSESLGKSSFQKLLSNAILSKDEIGDLCTYRCPGCKKLYHGMAKFRQHKHKHVSSSKCPLKGNGNVSQTHVENVVTHQCKLCSKLLLCDLVILKKHLRFQHKMTSIQDYAMRTTCTIKRSPDEITNEELCKSSPVSNVLGNYCTFGCDKCGYVSNGRLAMRQHLQTTGHGPGKVIKNWQKYIKKGVMHQCNICQRKILNDQESLSSHFRMHNGMSISEYKKKHKL